MIGRKRGAAEAGIKIHVKKEDFDSGGGGGDDEGDGEPEEKSEIPPPSHNPQRRTIKRSLVPSEGQTANLFAGIGSKFGQPTMPSFSSGAFGSGPFSGVGSATASTTSSSSTATTSVKPQPVADSPGFPQQNVRIPASSASYSLNGPTQQSTEDENYYRQMVALNTSFLNWLQAKVSSTPDASLVSGVQMYVEHCTNLKSKNGSAQSVSNMFSPAPKQLESQSALTSAVFNTSKPTETPKVNVAAPSTSSFGITPEAPAALFGNNSQPSLFSGLNAPNSTAGAATLFGSAGTSIFAQAPTPSASLFGTSSGLSFGGGQGGALFSAAGGQSADHEDGGEDDGEGGEDEPQEPSKQAQRHVNEDEETLFEVDPCKVMVLKDKVWSNRGGKGRLLVSRDKKTGKARAVLRAGTTGNLYFNAPLNKSMLGMLKKDKTKVMLVTQSFAPNEKGEMVLDDNPLLYALKVGTDAQAESLRSALEKAMNSGS